MGRDLAEALDGGWGLDEGGGCVALGSDDGFLGCDIDISGACGGDDYLVAGAVVVFVEEERGFVGVKEGEDAVDPLGEDCEVEC